MHDNSKISKPPKITGSPLVDLRVLLIGSLIFVGLFLISLNNYLLFHSLSEIFAIVISMAIFFFAWNSRQFIDNHYFILIGVAFLFSAILDVLHMLTYKGMGVLPWRGTDVASQLWIAARLMQSSAILLAPFAVGKQLKFRSQILVFLGITGLVVLSILVWEIFPVTFVEGYGQTAFKRTSEYIVIVLLLLSLVALWIKRKSFDTKVLAYVTAFTISSVLSEVCFVMYTDVYGAWNMVGHLLRVVSLYFMYKAIIETGLSEPLTVLFRNLKRREDELSAEKTKLQTYLEIAGVIIVIIGMDKKIKLINRKAVELMGFEASLMVGKSFEDFIPVNARDRALDDFELLTKGRVARRSSELPVLTRQGERLIAWEHTALYENDRIVGTVSSGEDITDKRRAEQELIRLASFPELNPTPVLELDMQGGIRYLNPFVTNILPELAEVGLRHPFLAEFEAIKSVLGAEDRKTFEREVRVNDRWFHQLFIYLKDFERIRLYSMEITQRVRFQDGLRQAEQRFRLAVDHYPSFFVIYNDRLEITFINTYGIRLCGMAREKIIGRHDKDIFVPEIYEKVLPILNRTFETRSNTTVECELDLPQGRQIFVMTYVPLLSEAGDVLQVIGIWHDITERKVAERELLKARDELELKVAQRTSQLRETNEILQRIFTISQFSIVYMDARFNFIRVNKAYADACGHSPEFFYGKNHFDLYPHAENRAIFESVVRTGRPYSVYAKPFIFPDDPQRKVTYWDWSLLPVKNPEDEVEGLVFFLIDVTQRKMAEEDLRLAQKELADSRRLSDIGTLAATVAHELRNPLAAIHMASFNMYRKAKNEALEKHFTTIEKKIQESDQIINNLLFYSRIKTPKFQDVDLNEVLEECITVAGKRSTNGVLIRRQFDRFPLIPGDPVQIKEIFYNLINNAFDAMYGRSGTITVSGSVDDNGVCVSVGDEGPGINEETIKKVYDPFFTTKAQGTGLGLTVCKQIVALHDGSIDIKNRAQGGTEVTVCLPARRKHE